MAAEVVLQRGAAPGLGTLPWLSGTCALLLVTALDAQDPGRFAEAIQAFERADVAQPPPAAPVLFVGSSTIRMWPELASAFPGHPVLNRGFGGSHMSDVLHYFDRVVTVYSPPLLVVYEGDNDLAGGKAATQVLADFREFLSRVRRALPEAGVIFLAVKPSPSRAALLAEQKALNAGIRELAATDPRVEFVDVFTPMLDEHGQPRAELIQPDMLHLNPAGYALWQSRLRPVLDALRPGAPRPAPGAADAP